MTRQMKAQHRADDLVFKTNTPWQRLCLTLIELACVLGGLFLFCLALHVVEVIA